MDGYTLGADYIFVDPAKEVECASRCLSTSDCTGIRIAASPGLVDCVIWLNQHCSRPHPVPPGYVAGGIPNVSTWLIGPSPLLGRGSLAVERTLIASLCETALLVLVCFRLVRRACKREVKVFLSYRVAADAALVESLYYKLTERGVSTWWDKECLVDGQLWEEGFADALFGSRVIVPFLSKAALAPFATLAADTPRCDNVLLEHVLALEQRERGKMLAIFPVFVGSVDEANGGEHRHFFVEGGVPDCESIPAVVSVEKKAREHLERQYGRARSGMLTEDRSPKAVLDRLLAHQGGFVQGDGDAALDAIADRVQAVVKGMEKAWKSKEAGQGEDGGLCTEGAKQEERVEVAIVHEDGMNVASKMVAPRMSFMQRLCNSLFRSRRRRRTTRGQSLAHFDAFAEEQARRADEKARLPPVPASGARRAAKAAQHAKRSTQPDTLDAFVGSGMNDGEDEGMELALNPIMRHRMESQQAPGSRGGGGPSKLSKLGLGSGSSRDQNRSKLKGMSRWLEKEEGVIDSDRGLSGMSASTKSALSETVARAERKSVAVLDRSKRLSRMRSGPSDMGSRAGRAEKRLCDAGTPEESSQGSRGVYGDR
jgi:hypothetical protein